MLVEIQKIVKGTEFHRIIFYFTVALTYFFSRNSLRINFRNIPFQLKGISFFLTFYMKLNISDS